MFSKHGLLHQIPNHLRLLSAAPSLSANSPLHLHKNKQFRFFSQFSYLSFQILTYIRRLMEWPASPPSPPVKQKIRSTNCFSCCFRSSDSGEDQPVVGPSLIRSSSMWIKSKASELPEIKEGYRWLMARSSKSSRPAIGEFRYDPLSYALNFDEGVEEEADEADGFRYRNFSSRLPATPLQSVAGVSCR